MNSLHQTPPRVHALGCLLAGLLAGSASLPAGEGDVFDTVGDSPAPDAERYPPDIFGRQPIVIPALRGFYFGAGFGAFHTDYSDSVDDGSVSMVDDGDTGTALGFFLGYHLNDFISVEGGFSTSDDVDYDAVSDGSGDSWAAGPVSADYEADMYTIDLVGRYPIAPKWWLLGRLGYMYWETKETFNEDGFISTDSDSGSSARLGLGLEYDIGIPDFVKWRFELGYHHIGGDDDLDVFTGGIGVIRQF